MTTFTFSPDDMAMMQEAQTGHMQDTCRILVYQAGERTGYGKRQPVYSDGPTIECGLSFPSRQYEAPGGSQFPLTEARLRVPFGTAIKPSDRILVTHRFGIMKTTPERFEVIGLAGQGPSGILLNLKRVTSEADNG